MSIETSNTQQDGNVNHVSAPGRLWQIHPSHAHGDGMADDNPADPRWMLKRVRLSEPEMLCAYPQSIAHVRERIAAWLPAQQSPLPCNQRSEIKFWLWTHNQNLLTL